LDADGKFLSSNQTVKETENQMKKPSQIPTNKSGLAAPKKNEKPKSHITMALAAPALAGAVADKTSPEYILSYKLNSDRVETLDALQDGFAFPTRAATLDWAISALHWLMISESNGWEVGRYKPGTNVFERLVLPQPEATAIARSLAKAIKSGKVVDLKRFSLSEEI
jgi:hypothetical protein